MMKKMVPGFCTEECQACHILKVGEFDELVKIKEIRTYLKGKIIKIQGDDIFKEMMKGSKTSKVLLNEFCYTGKLKEYLLKLKFDDAKSIFLLRY